MHRYIPTLSRTKVTDRVSQQIYLPYFLSPTYPPTAHQPPQHSYTHSQHHHHHRYRHPHSPPAACQTTRHPSRHAASSPPPHNLTIPSPDPSSPVHHLSPQRCDHTQPPYQQPSAEPPPLSAPADDPAGPTSASTRLQPVQCALHFLGSPPTTAPGPWVLEAGSGGPAAASTTGSQLLPKAGPAHGDPQWGRHRAAPNSTKVKMQCHRDLCAFSRRWLYSPVTPVIASRQQESRRAGVESMVES